MDRNAGAVILEMIPEGGRSKTERVIKESSVDSLEIVAEEIIKAIKEGDAGMTCDALKAFVKIASREKKEASLY